MPAMEQAVVHAFIREVAFTYERVHVLTSLFASHTSHAGHGSHAGPGSHASRTWTTAEELAALTNTPALLLHEALQELRDAGFVAQDASDRTRFSYADGDAERDSLLRALQQLSDEDPVELARLLNAVALERARDALYARLDIPRR